MPHAFVWLQIMSFLSSLLTTKALAVGGLAAVGLYAVKRHFSGGVCKYNKSNFSLKASGVFPAFPLHSLSLFCTTVGLTARPLCF
jgi:hypothetical protein